MVGVHETGVGPMAVASFYLTQHQVPQNQTWNCGAAAAAQVVKSWYYDLGLLTTNSALDGHSLSQAWLGRAEYTNANASHTTDWNHNDMRRALNNWLFGEDPYFYAQREPTSVADLEDYVTYDLYPNEWMLAADTIERKNNSSLHYNHHPLDRDIYHWTTIRGYYNSGSGFAFEDPAANTTVLSSDWDDVAPYFNMTSTKTYNLMKNNGIDARGIVW